MSSRGLDTCCTSSYELQVNTGATSFFLANFFDFLAVCIFLEAKITASRSFCYSTRLYRLEVSASTQRISGHHPNQNLKLATQRM